MLLSFPVRGFENMAMYAGFPVHRPDFEDTPRENRTPLQWIKSVLSYLEWRAYSCSKPGLAPFRQPLEQRNYIAAIRIVARALYAPEPLAEPIEAHAPPVNPRLAKLAALPRPELVARIQALDPALTDGRILGRLQRSKIAAMILQLEESLPKKKPVHRSISPAGETRVASA